MDFIIFSFTQNLLPLWVLRNFAVVPVTCIRNLGSTFKFLTPLTLPLQTHTHTQRMAGSPESLSPHFHPCVQGSLFLINFLPGASLLCPEMMSCCPLIFIFYPSDNEVTICCFGMRNFSSVFVSSCPLLYLCRIRLSSSPGPRCPFYSSFKIKYPLYVFLQDPWRMCH